MTDLTPEVAGNVVVLVTRQRLLGAAAAGRGAHHPPGADLGAPGAGPRHRADRADCAPEGRGRALGH